MQEYVVDKVHNFAHCTTIKDLMVSIYLCISDGLCISSIDVACICTVYIIVFITVSLCISLFNNKKRSAGWCISSIGAVGACRLCVAGWMIAGLSRADYEADCPK